MNTKFRLVLLLLFLGLLAACRTSPTTPLTAQIAVATAVASPPAAATSTPSVPASTPQFVPKGTPVPSLSVPSFPPDSPFILAISVGITRTVLGPNHDSLPINRYDGLWAISDEHSSIIAPGMLGNNQDYLFFVASGSSFNMSLANDSIGVTVLSSSGPDNNGQWTLDYPPKDEGYGWYPDQNKPNNSGFGQVFIPPTQQGRCPVLLSGETAANQDQTFDLDYAAAGSIVKDTRDGPGTHRLLMVYEGTNGCRGNSGGLKKTGTDAHPGSYVTIGIATSRDNGRTWPSYKVNSIAHFTPAPLPHSNETQGPRAPSGATGNSVCMGNVCATGALPTPPPSYGRYAVLSPPTPLAALMPTPVPFDAVLGDGEPSAFLDDVSGGVEPYLYIVHGYNPGCPSGLTPKDCLVGPPISKLRNDDLTIARTQLMNGSTKLTFFKWDGTSFNNRGIGGLEAPILSDGPYRACGDPSQHRTSGSISYVEETGQYLLAFICSSKTDPATGASGPGAAWFYANSYDLSQQQWSTPQEIIGSWGPFEPSTNLQDTQSCSFYYQGWYPTFMSPNMEPSHLSTTGYAFSMAGCVTSGSVREYLSRAFTIKISMVPHCPPERFGTPPPCR